MHRVRFVNEMEKLYPLNDRVRRLSKRETNFVIAQRVIRDFLNNTSIHGFNYLDEGTRNGGPVVKLFWACTLVAAFVGSGLMLRVFWNRYQSDSTMTVVDSFHVPSFVGVFPALTICSMIMPERKIREEVLAKLHLPPNTSKEEASYLIKNIFDLAHHHSTEFEQQLKLDEILNMNGLNMLDFLKTLRGNCRDMIESCWWNEKNMSCRQFFRINHSFNGLCCSFNYDLEDNIDKNRTRRSTTAGMIPTAGYGVRSGLTLVFKENQFILNHDNGSIARKMSHAVGLMLYIHHSLQYPTAFDVALQAGQEMQLGVFSRGNAKVRGKSRKNELPCVASDEVTLKYFRSYKISNCQNACRIRAALSLCGCIPWQYAPFAADEDGPICEFRNFKCLSKNFRRIWLLVYENPTEMKCICPEKCRGGSFVIKHADIPLAESPNFAPSLIYRNISNKKAVLRLFIAHEIFENLGTLRITTEIYMLSSLGGIFNLFLGCSILSLFEIVYFLLVLIKSCCSASQGN